MTTKNDTTANIVKIIVAIASAITLVAGGYYGGDAVRGAEAQVAAPTAMAAHVADSDRRYASTESVARLETKIDYLSEDIGEIKAFLKSVCSCAQ